MPKSRVPPARLARDLRIARARRAIDQLLRAAERVEDEFSAELEALAPTLRESGFNLVHYLAARRYDLRPLQDDLARLGLSSLGRMEAHVQATLLLVRDALAALAGEAPPDAPAAPAIDFETGGGVLAEHADALLGPGGGGSSTRIMVTMPSEAADDATLIRDLLADGMTVMRINCAHDGPEVWAKMIKRLRRAEREVGRTCMVSFDLAGPKLRTGAIDGGVPVAKWRPHRDRLGKVIAPAQVRFRMRTAAAGDDPGIVLEGPVITKARVGDTLTLTDTRERERVLTVAEVNGGDLVCESTTTAYVIPGTAVLLRRGQRTVARGRIGALPPSPQWITLRPGDALAIVLGEQPGHEMLHDEDGAVIDAATLSCPLPEVFQSVRVGERIFFDDGRIAGVIRAVTDDRLSVEITTVPGGAAKLRGEKGINLPDSELRLPALTEQDLADLAFAVKHADLVALSFAQRPEDVEQLYTHLDALGGERIGVVLKIETQAGFNRLPQLLLASMRRRPVGVMVARGDLGVEVGFERLSEVQEEILWLCEAAHVPVIWATQVLESLAKGGLPSRAEVTDAAMAGRAECVMLNKGPFIRETLRFLVDVLGRMREHQAKKTTRLRRLSVSDAPQGTRGRTAAT